MKHFKSKISRLLVIYIVIFSSIVTLVLTAIQLRIDYNAGINVIHQRINQIKTTNLDSITQSLWTIDHSSIEIQLDGLSRIHDIVLVKIIDENDKLIASAGEINTKDPIIDRIKLYQHYRGQDILLGTLTVVATKENVYQQLIDTVIVILISQAIKTFLVSLFILIIFYYLVTRHLEKIARHSDKLELNRKPQELTLNRNSADKSKEDELDRVVKSINNMAANIYHSYNEWVTNQKELTDREALFSAMFNSMTDAIIFADSNRNILQTNSAFHEQFGYSKEELKGKTTLMLYANPDEYMEQGKKRYNASTKSTPTIYEIDYRRKDGSTFPSETVGGAVLLPDGTQIGLIGIIRDITARNIEFEEKLKLQKELQQSQKMQAIGQLTGGIAHDFNNILSSILGYAELSLGLLKEPENSKLIRYVKQITVAGERASNLVEQLLSFSRKDPGEPQAINIKTLINDVILLLRPTIPSSIKLVANIDENIPAIFMDNTQMHQILMNLCINSRDAMNGNGTLKINVTHEHNIRTLCDSCKEPVNGDYVVISVEDTGTGIEENILDTIFDPFLTTKEVGKGSGMGLSVVHGILHKHHSHINVKTELGVGTQFKLLIPPMNENVIKAESVQPSTASVSHDDGKGKHILIVDDEETIALFLQELLEMYNYKVSYTTSSKQAIKIFKEHASSIDLVITDQTMPELTGTEMIQQLFQIRADVPVILCSGYNELVGEKEAIELGCVEYLSKPVNNQVLLQSIQNALVDSNS